MFSVSPCSTTAPFEKVVYESFDQLDYHARYWWASSGHALAILLERAGYTSHSQYTLLKFIRAITPTLGPAPLPGTPRLWKSFMTDDHTPIEISWDWGTGDKPPKIRFSIEPVGIGAGTQLDPENQYAAAHLRAIMATTLPDTNMQWLKHFQEQLNGEDIKGSVEGHATKEFYAFDLNSDAIESKAYFFPGYKARATKQTNFAVIRDTIQSAPGCELGKLQALDTFQEYMNDAHTPNLEMDMLAIDLVDPSESRFKIYFRIRDTSFASVVDAITLGGRIDNPELDQGVPKLRRLYFSLLNGSNGEDMSDQDQLPSKEDRTAGILYNMSFRYGSKAPKIKAYLPVRHYAKSELATISALGTFMDDSRATARANVVNYIASMQTLYSDEVLKSRSGIHTYIGCSIETAGDLRLVSYINPH
ncbi:aromatic prenyltransferase [Stachybotrys elegans]|uniref:Aromatic prenyltransferase n=1 Tax=Stachybotrys elegans TaxID=80388 RepID=A0A8K0SWR6_9HYPO|nr:aromatic prenyltransferase [Stachybotrys elegans]